LSAELEKHWNEFNKIVKNFYKNQEKLYQGFIPKRGIYYRFISVHRLITAFILGLTIYFLTYIFPSWVHNYWKQIIGMLVAVVYLFLDAIRDWMKVKSDC